MKRQTQSEGGASRQTRGRRARSAQRRSTKKSEGLEKSGDGMSVITATRERMGRRVGRALTVPDALPLAIGTFMLGTLAGVLGAVYLPRIRSSRLVEDIGEDVGHTVDAAKEKAKDTVRNVAGDGAEGGTPAPPV